MALIEVKRYNCEFCGKDFKTPDRHICKFDPKFKNCHSCTHCLGFKKMDAGYDCGGHDVKELFPICNLEEDPESITYSEYSAKDICNNGYTLNCDSYEWCGGRWVDYMNDNHVDYENPLDNWPF